ncbi:MAG: hypothetical protein RIF34_02000, partial [Candidatus Kapaibacterium sp.]
SYSQVKNWVEKHYSEGEYEEFTELVCKGDSVCYIFANHSATNRLYKSTDKGQSWLRIYNKNHLPKGNPELRDTVWNLGECAIINDSCFFISYYDSNVIDITKDGGNSFRRIALKGT